MAVAIVHLICIKLCSFMFPQKDQQRQAMANRCVSKTKFARGSRKRHAPRNMFASQFVRKNWETFATVLIGSTVRSSPHSSTGKELRQQLLDSFLKANVLESNKDLSESDLTDAIEIVWRSKYRKCIDGPAKTRIRTIKTRLVNPINVCILIFVCAM